VENDSSYVQFPATSSRAQSGMVSTSYLNCPQLTGPVLDYTTYDFSFGLDVFITRRFIGYPHTFSSISVTALNNTGGAEQFQWITLVAQYVDNFYFYSGLFNSSGSLESGAYYSFSPGINFEGWQRFIFTIESSFSAPNYVNTFKMKYYDLNGTFQSVTFLSPWTWTITAIDRNNIGCMTYSNFSRAYILISMLSYL
jgi:hypothetical protein